MPSPPKHYMYTDFLSGMRGRVGTFEGALKGIDFWQTETGGWAKCVKKEGCRGVWVALSVPPTVDFSSGRGFTGS